MDRFVFQPGAARMPRTRKLASRAPTTRRRGELGQRTRSSPRIQSHPCNPATPAAQASRSSRCRSRRAAIRRWTRLTAAVSNRDGRADDRQPRRHGHLQSADQGMGAHRPRGGRAVLLRPRQFQRRDEQDRVRASSASTPACSCCTRLSARQGRRRAGGRRLRLHAPSWRRSCRRRVVTLRRQDAMASADSSPRVDRQGARVLGQRPAGHEGVCLDARHGCGRDRRGVGHLGAGQQLHGDGAARRSAA